MENCGTLVYNTIKLAKYSLGLWQSMGHWSKTRWDSGMKISCGSRGNVFGGVCG